MKTRLIAQKAQMNNNSLPQGEIVNRVMGIKEWGLIIILSIIWGGVLFLCRSSCKRDTTINNCIMPSRSRFYYPLGYSLF